MASKLWSVLSARMAMRLNSLSLQKKFSIRWRHLYISVSICSGMARRGCCAITTLAPRWSRLAMMSLLSKAVSAIKAPNSRSSLSGATPMVSKRCPGSRVKRTRLPRASVRARILVVMPPLERPMAWPAVPLLRPVRDGEPCDSGIDHGVFHVRLVRDGIKQPFENVGSSPVAISLEDGVPAAKQGRQIAPGAAGSRDPQHRFDKAPIVRAAAAGVRLLPPAMRFHLRPLSIGQYISIHSRLEPQYLAQTKPNLNRP